MKYKNKCKCIKDVGIKDIIVGNLYKFYKKDFDVIAIMYNETDKTFEEIYGTNKWFYDNFEILYSE